jgi:hypothetical protein
MKQLSNRERNRRKYLKMYKSVENKMQGNNLICWNSLSLRAKYHLVFQWKSQPKDKKFKHFIKEYFPKYRISISNRRNAIIEHLLN